ncbi:hypothetical protein ACN20G_29210 (plasmid) [Streptomyces sp. BI20]|uniref:hypothetical protein n=1 Tax=Streptomyces sp. BI20 TaxID=3403460 RepID=UPI003C75E25E
MSPFERLVHVFDRHSPLHFTLVAEFPVPLDAARLRAALAAVWERHPLPAARITREPGRAPVLHPPAAGTPPALTLVDGDPAGWRTLAAEEMARRLPTADGALHRAVLLSSADASTLLLTLDHSVADGVGAAVVLADLVAALNGHPPRPLPAPPSRETLFDRLPPPSHEPLPAPPVPASAPRRALRPFDGVPPHVSTAALDRPSTARLRARCRADGVTVQAALVTAATRARAVLRAEDTVARTLTPVDLRPLLGVTGGCAAHFGHARTASTPRPDLTFREHVRATAVDLAAARDPAVLAAASAHCRREVPACPTEAEALAIGRRTLDHELIVTNLRTLPPHAPGPVRVRAVWGPITLCRLDGEEVLGVVTHEGGMRLTACSHEDSARALPHRVAELLAAYAP